MTKLVQTPYKMTLEETLSSVAVTLCLLRLEKAGVPKVPVREICSQPQYGFTAPASPIPLGPRFVRITDIQQGTVDWGSVPYCECDEPEKYRLIPGNILIARTGSVGKSLLVTDVPNTAVFASYLIRLQVKAGVWPQYLYWCLQSQQFWQQIMESRRGSAIKNINAKMLQALQFSYPPVTVQESIIAFLEAFQQRLNGSDIALPELPAPLAEQRHIVARIEELAAKVEAARALREQAAQQVEALFASAADAVFRLKSGWTEAKVGDFCEKPQYGYTESAIYEPVGPRFLRITDIQNGQVNWDTVPFCSCPQPEKYLLRENDILFARTGATTGKSFLVRNCPEAVFASYLIRLRVQRLIVPEYLYWYFQSPSYWSQITEEKKGTGQPNVNGKKLANVQVPIAPLSEQRRIVAYLDDLQARVDAVKAHQAATAAALDALLPSILDQAFKGEL